MNQAQLQDATDRAQKEEKGASGAAFGLVFWGFILWAVYGYFFG